MKYQYRVELYSIDLIDGVSIKGFTTLEKAKEDYFSTLKEIKNGKWNSSTTLSLFKVEDLTPEMGKLLYGKE